MKRFGEFSVTVALVLVPLLLIVFCGTAAFAQQKYTLKFNHVLGQKEIHMLIPGLVAQRAESRPLMS